MAEKHAKDARFFLSRATSSNEYASTNAVLVKIRNSVLKRIYRTYAPLFKKNPFAHDDLTQLVFLDHSAIFVKLEEDGMPNMAGLTKYMEGNERLVEIPADTYDMLVQRTENSCTRTDYETLQLDDSGIHWEALDHYGSDTYETEKFWWTEIGIRRKRKEK